MTHSEAEPGTMLRTWYGQEVKPDYVCDLVESAAGRRPGHVALLEKYIGGELVLQVQLVTLQARLLLVEIKTPAHPTCMRLQAHGSSDVLVELVIDVWHPIARRGALLTASQALIAVGELLAGTLTHFTAAVAFDLHTDVAEHRRAGPDQPR
jgi:hypothetical protein